MRIFLQQQRPDELLWATMNKGLFYTAEGLVVPINKLPPEAYDIYFPRIELCRVENILDELSLVTSAKISDIFNHDRNLRKRKATIYKELETEDALSDDDYDPKNLSSSESENDFSLSQPVAVVGKLENKRPTFANLQGYTTITHVCYLCNPPTSWEQVGKLREHMKEHKATNGKVSCANCHYASVSMPNLLRHMSIHEKSTAHSQQKQKLLKQEKRSGVTYTCFYCEIDDSKELNSEWVGLSAYSAHMKQHKNKKGVFPCPMCPEYTAKAVNRFTQHMKEKHGICYNTKKNTQRVFQCLLCTPTRNFTTQYYLQDHMNERHRKNGRFHCRQCGHFSTTAIKRINCHVKTQCTGIQHKNRCLLCVPLKTFQTTKTFQHHLTKYHKTSLGHFCCVICDAELKSHETIVDHMNTHLDLIPLYYCRLCTPVTSFFQLSPYKAHLRDIHFIHGFFKCPKCKKTFDSNKKNFREHMRSHDKRVCQLVVSWAQHILEEMREKWRNDLKNDSNMIGKIDEEGNLSKEILSTVERNSKEIQGFSEFADLSEAGLGALCLACGFIPQDPEELRVHMEATHERFGRFSCTSCGNRFKNQVKLDRHVDIVHHCIKNYDCKTCGGKYTTDKSLKCHIKKIHENRPPGTIRCWPCKKIFWSKLAFVEHRRHCNLVKLRKTNCRICYRTFSCSTSLRRHVESIHWYSKGNKNKTDGQWRN